MARSTPCSLSLNFAPLADYCASKAAVVTLHESLRYELDHKYVS